MSKRKKMNKTTYGVTILGAFIARGYFTKLDKKDTV